MKHSTDASEVLPSPRAAGSQRFDIEGLRAVAVLLVVADHLLGFPKGGFVGVDIFFVISGFLITGLLVREQARTGTISFRGFYARRVRRIVPAAASTLVATCVMVWLVFVGTRVRETLTDAGWSALSLANWHFANVGTDYFQSGRPPSPLQHYWSLAVEEQFYLVWPMLVVGVGLLARSRRLPITPTLVTVIGGVVMLSLAWSVLDTRDNMTVAYFSTPARAWELGLGALLALASPALSSLPAWGGWLLVHSGLAGLAVAVLVIGPGSSFPAPWALLPVLATTAIIAGGLACPNRSGKVILTNLVSRYIGRISYSVYLWHWPVIVVLAAVVAPHTPTYIALVALISALLAMVSYHAVEAPIRESSWLQPMSATSSWNKRQTVRRQMHVALSGLAAAIAVTLAVLTLSVQPSSGDEAVVAAGSTLAVGGSRTIPRSTGLQGEIEAALVAQSWPTLSPSIDELDSSKAKEWRGCGNVAATTMAACRFGNESAPRSKQVMVLGDSIGISWLPGIRGALEPLGWRIQGMTWGQCPASRIDVTAPGEAANFTATCAAHQTWVLQQVLAERPGLVVLAGAENSLGRMPCCTSVKSALAAWGRAEQSLIASISKAGVDVVVLAPPPVTKNLASCATRFNTPAACTAQIDDTWRAMGKVDAAAAKVPRARYVDTESWFCNDGFCPPFAGTTTMMADGTHLTDTYSRKLAPQLRAALTEPR